LALNVMYQHLSYDDSINLLGRKKKAPEVEAGIEVNADKTVCSCLITRIHDRIIIFKDS